MNVPKLRFPEFSGEWEEKKVKDIFSIKNGLNKEKEFFGKGIPILNYMDVNGRVSNDQDCILGLVDLSEEEINRYSVNPNDLFFTRTSETSNEIGLSSSFVGENIKCVFSGFLLRARPIKDDVNSLFYAYYFRSPFNRKKIIKHSSITTRALISGSNLSQINISVPNLEEQEKIASFLSKVDKKIEKLEKKQELWETYKKGMMQKIFSQELRFKDENGENYPDWEEKRLGDVVNIPKKQKLSSVDNETLLTVKLHCKGIAANYSIQPKITKRGRPYFKRNAGELLIGRQNFHNGGIGLVPDELDGFISSNAITSLRIDEEKILKRYLLYYFSRRDYYKKAEVIMGGTGQKELSDKNLLKLEIKIPLLNEQHKIAKFLFSIENKIDLGNLELEMCVNFKKGLLQQMFC